MKKIIPGILLVLTVPAISVAQTLSDLDTGKYSINLPDYWKPGNKIWRILSDKLPLVCEELKDKELCGDHCNPKYSIEFEMSEPVIFDYFANHISSGSTTQTWEFVTMYSFSSSLLLLNEKNELLTKFILVDTNEVWRVVNKAQLASYMPPPPKKIYVQNPPYLPNGESINRMSGRSGTAGQSPYSYINSNKDNLSPTRGDMLNIIDEKIRSW